MVVREPSQVSAVILGYSQFESTTKRCLNSLLSESAHLNDLVVVDNGSPDASAEQLQRYFQELDPKYTNIYLKIFQQNLGFAQGFNQSFEDVSINSNWFLLIGSDTVFPPGVLSRMLRTLQNIPNKIGIVGPVTNSAGTSQRIFYHPITLKDYICYALDDSSEESLVVPVYRADFFCVAIRTSLWRKLNGLSLDYGRGYYEDFDFCMRAKNLGYQSALLENIHVFHQGSASFKTDKDQSQLINKNKKIFIEKFPSAKLLHVREDNFQTLSYLLNNTDKTSASIKNIDLRFQYLKNDLPRGLLKRYLWNQKIKKIEVQYEQWKGNAS